MFLGSLSARHTCPDVGGGFSCAYVSSFFVRCISVARKKAIGGETSGSWDPIRLVQAKRPKTVSATQAACNSCSNITCSVSYLPPYGKWKRVTQLFHFVKSLELALAAERCPHRPQAFKKVNDSQALP